MLRNNAEIFESPSLALNQRALRNTETKRSIATANLETGLPNASLLNVYIVTSVLVGLASPVNVLIQAAHWREMPRLLTLFPLRFRGRLGHDFGSFLRFRGR